MRYIVKGIEVRSENVAKSIKEVSRPLVEWLKNRDMTDTALDYGCGKLRYTKFVAMKSLHLGIVDSKLQLDRSQQINGLVTTVRRYAESKWPECKYTIWRPSLSTSQINTTLFCVPMFCRPFRVLKCAPNL
jgi:hypothetical protein